MKRFLSAAALLGSVSTLICCVLPALFVALGFGASFAALIGAVPQLTWFSEHKLFVFSMGAILIVTAGLLQWRSRYLSCPTDPDLAKACASTKGWSRRAFVIAVIVYMTGFTFAFVLPRLI